MSFFTGTVVTHLMIAICCHLFCYFAQFSSPDASVAVSSTHSLSTLPPDYLEPVDLHFRLHVTFTTDHSKTVCLVLSDHCVAL